MDIELIKVRLRKMMSKERFEHSINVSQVARKLALKYNHSEVAKAEVAGLLHDCAKDLDYNILEKMRIEYNIKNDEIIQKIPKLLHPLVGAAIAEKEFNIQDPAILKAIRSHSTGAPRMSLLDKIIYLSDKIEPLRNNEGVEEARKIAEFSLDRAVLKVLDMGLLYLINKGFLIHPVTIEARNDILGKVVLLDV